MTMPHMYGHMANEMVFVFKSTATIQARMFWFLTTFKTHMPTEGDHPAIHFLTPRTGEKFLFLSFRWYTQSCSLLTQEFSAHQ